MKETIHFSLYYKNLRTPGLWWAKSNIEHYSKISRLDADRQPS